MPFLLLIGLSCALHFYIGARLVPDFPAGGGAAVLGAGLVASALLMPLGLVARRVAKPPASDRLAWLGLALFGLFSSLLVFTFLRDVLLLAAWPFGGDAGALRRGSAAAVVLLALGVTAVGFFNARRVAATVRVRIPLPGLPPALEGFTIVQVSDIHVGPTIKAPYVQKIVDEVNRLQPDLVAITGDLVDGSVAELRDHVAPLARLQARHGVFFVTGNHEYYSGVGPWLAELRRLGVRPLLNEHVVVRRGDAELVVAGVPDHGAGHFEARHRPDPAAALAGSPSGAVKVLLAHQPRTAAAAAAAGFDLQLSGHTHGGQFLPWNFFVRLQQPYTAGLHRAGRMWVYVSRGTGYWGPPKRFGAPSEITVVELVGTHRPAV